MRASVQEFCRFQLPEVSLLDRNMLTKQDTVDQRFKGPWSRFKRVLRLVSDPVSDGTNCCCVMLQMVETGNEGQSRLKNMQNHESHAVCTKAS